MTQNEIIIRHLKTFGRITPVEAMNEYGIMRLASRIHDLKQEGYRISSENKVSINRFGEKVHYASYRLVS